MPTIAQILSARKDHKLAALPPTATVRQALDLMSERNIGSVLVMMEESLLGIFTERDYARKIALQGRSSTGTLLSDVMTSHLHVVSPRHTVRASLAIMAQANLRHLPVIDEEQVVGLVSIRDLVNAQLTVKAK